MALQYGGQIFLDLTPEGVHGLPGLSVHRLGFSFQYRLHAWQPGIVARNFRASVLVSKVGSAPTYLGTAWPESAWVLQVISVPRDGHYCFRIDIADSDLERIEVLRAGGDLQFNLAVMCEVSGADREAHPAQENVYFNVNRAAWVDILSQFGLERRLLLEVELPEIGDEALRGAAQRLRRARAEYDAGNYDGVVRECRIALESVKNALELDAEVKSALSQYLGNERRSMTKRARALLLSEFAIHYAHLAHHPDEQGAILEFGRRDAAFALAIAAAVVANNASLDQ